MNKLQEKILEYHTHGELVKPDEIVYRKEDVYNLLELMREEMVEHMRHNIKHYNNVDDFRREFYYVLNDTKESEQLKFKL